MIEGRIGCSLNSHRPDMVDIFTHTHTHKHTHTHTYTHTHTNKLTYTELSK